MGKNTVSVSAIKNSIFASDDVLSYVAVIVLAPAIALSESKYTMASPLLSVSLSLTESVPIPLVKLTISPANAAPSSVMVAVMQAVSPISKLA